jgi:transcriptional regulator with XRE-family HTH domain
VTVQDNSRRCITLGAKNIFAPGYPVGLLPTFGENLKRLRTRAGLKNKELAAKVAVKPPTVSAWERDRGGLPETPTLFKLAKALGCPIEELLQGVDAEYEAAAEKRRQELLDRFGKRLAVDFDEPGAYDRYNEMQRLIGEAEHAGEQARLARAIQFALTYRESDLPRHTDDHRSGSPQGGPPDVPASDDERRELFELRERVKAIEAALGELQDVASRITRLAVRGAESRETAQPATDSSGSDRKTG